jgi:hypothetical protein
MNNPGISHAKRRAPPLNAYLINTAAKVCKLLTLEKARDNGNMGGKEDSCFVEEVACLGKTMNDVQPTKAGGVGRGGNQLQRTSQC